LLVGWPWVGRSNLIQELLDETHDLERSLHVGPMPKTRSGDWTAKAAATAPPSE